MIIVELVKKGDLLDAQKPMAEKLATAVGCAIPPYRPLRWDAIWECHPSGIIILVGEAVGIAGETYRVAVAVAESDWMQESPRVQLMSSLMILKQSGELPYLTLVKPSKTL